MVVIKGQGQGKTKAEGSRGPAILKYDNESVGDRAVSQVLDIQQRKK